MRFFSLSAPVCALSALLLCSCHSVEEPLRGLPLGIIGIEEPVFVMPFETPFAAKIDTGADTSSIDAEEIRLIQRDGGKFVSFKIRQRGTQKEHSFELPLKRRTSIVRHGSQAQPRYTVMLTVRIGPLTMEREFSLADRKNFKYQVLIGRNIISGMAAVDPSRRNLTGAL